MGMWVNFECYTMIPQSGGQPGLEKMKDGVMVDSINAFRKAFPRAAIISYGPADEEGTINPARLVQVNERLPPIPVNRNVGAISIETIKRLSQNAAAHLGEADDNASQISDAQAQREIQELAISQQEIKSVPNHAPVVVQPVEGKAPEKIYTRGGITFKMKGNRLFELSWEDYQRDGVGPDEKIRVVDTNGNEVDLNDLSLKIQRAVWLELSE